MSTRFAGTRDEWPARSVVEMDNKGSLLIDTDLVRSVLASHYGADVGGEALVPPEEPARLRSRLRSELPQLAALTDEVRGLFDNGACGILITRLGLNGLGIDDQRKAIFALSALLGDVTWAHPVDDHVVWDVKNQGVGQTGVPRYSSFSENDREAEYHTDASFATIPDRYFLLYSVRQAECGGGQTFVSDGRALKCQLEETVNGRSAVRVLSETKLPMRVPKAFRNSGNCAADGYSYVTIISDEPMWRFRKDKIEKGLIARRNYATAEVRKALDVVYESLAYRHDEFRRTIPTDGILIVDNHLALHGRTAFTDPGRHLLRARFHKPAEWSNSRS